MRPLLFLTLVIILFLSCRQESDIATLSSLEKEQLESYKSLSKRSRTEMVDDQEPGEPLHLCLTFVNKKDGAPLANAKIQIYHTASDGQYHQSNPADPLSARLSSSAQTDRKGRIYVKTILPGSYDSSGNDRHIHTVVKNAQPENYDIHFKQFSSLMSRNFIDGSDQHFLADLKKNENGSLTAFVTMKIKGYPSQ